MLHAIKSYLQFLWNSKNEHGVHSPFVFDLVTKCFYDKKLYKEYEQLDSYRKKLLANSETITVKDFGAGSRVFKADSREVRAIVKNAGISRKRAQLLFRICRYFNPNTILEIGTSVSLATSAMATAVSRAEIISLEGCPETARIASEQLTQAIIANCKIVIGEFENSLNELSHDQRFDLIYFDGNHQKEATLNYFEKLLPTAGNDACWIFDDIHWSKEMELAWNEIKNHPKVTVTVDTYQWGFVFFRSEQQKEHFVLRC